MKKELKRLTRFERRMQRERIENAVFLFLLGSFFGFIAGQVVAWAR